MSKLSELRERVEGASGPDRKLDALIAVAIGGFFLAPRRFEGEEPRYGYIDANGTEVLPGNSGDQLVPRLTASIDAALALVERLHPDVGVVLSLDREEPRLARASLVGERIIGQNAATLPLAILSALLRALDQQDPTHGG